MRSQSPQALKDTVSRPSLSGSLPTQSRKCRPHPRTPHSYPGPCWRSWHPVQRALLWSLRGHIVRPSRRLPWPPTTVFSVPELLGHLTPAFSTWCRRLCSRHNHSRCPPGTAQPYLSPWVSPSSWRASEWRFLLEPSFTQALFHRVPSCPHPAIGVPTLQLWLHFPGIPSWAGPALAAEAVQPNVGKVCRWTVDRGLPENSTLFVDCPQTVHTHRKRIYTAVPTLSQSVWVRGEAGFLC